MARGLVSASFAALVVPIAKSIIRQFASCAEIDIAGRTWKTKITGAMMAVAALLLGTLKKVIRCARVNYANGASSDKRPQLQLRKVVQLARAMRCDGEAANRASCVPARSI